MVMLNARCFNCSTVFPAGIELSGDFSDASFEGNIAGPCPRCGSMGNVIANGTTISVRDNKVTVVKGRLSQADLYSLASTLTTYTQNQSNRNEVEEMILQTFPQLNKVVRRVSNENLVKLAALLLTLVALWTNQPGSRRSIDRQIQQLSRSFIAEERQLAAEIKSIEATTVALEFEAYEKGKLSIHAIRNKIIKFFPALIDHIEHMTYAEVLATLSIILTALNRWKPAGKLENYGPSKEQYEELIKSIDKMSKNSKNDQDL